MGRRKELSEVERSSIVLLSSEGYSSRQIVEKMPSLSQSCVVKTLKRFHSTGGFFSLRRTGRPSKTDDRTNRRMKNEVRANPFVTAREIKDIMNPTLNNISVRTIRHKLQKTIRQTLTR